ncbi:MAG: NAD(P)-dependent alcohol dehydrogenase, partial [Bacteroidetes bacterium]
MKSIQITRYGGPEVLTYAERSRPSPKPEEVIVKVHAASINSADRRIMSANPWFIKLAFGWNKPKVTGLGTDFSGEIVELGKDVTQWKVGDMVFGDMSNLQLGTLAEYLAVPAKVIAQKPTRLSHVESASLPLASRTALEAIRDHGKLSKGQHILIVGASGGVGNSAIQLAKAHGGIVTAVCSTKNVEKALELGADHVIDYKRQSFADNDVKYDIILGVNAYEKPCVYAEQLKPGGKFI